MKKTIIIIAALLAVTVTALGIDEVAYWSWTSRMARVAASFQTAVSQNKNFWSIDLPPSNGFLSKPNLGFIVAYQPPQLAWTYRLSLHSKIGYRIISGYIRLKRWALGGRVDPEFLNEHSPYHLGVVRCMSYDPCSPKDSWLPYVEHQIGSF